MRYLVIALTVLTCLAETIDAETPQQAFVKRWKGQPIVVKTVLYSLIYNERGRLGTTKSGRREGVLVVTPLRGHYFQFNGRQGRNTVVAKDSEVLVKLVSAEYEPDTLDVRSYRKLEALAIHRFEPGVELVVSDVRVDRDEVTLAFSLPDDRPDAITSLRVKWPLPISPSFGERPPVEDVIRRFVEIKQP